MYESRDSGAIPILADAPKTQGATTKTSSPTAEATDRTSDVDNWQRLGLGQGLRVPVRVAGKDDMWLFVTGATELPPVVWVTLARRIRVAG